MLRRICAMESAAIALLLYRMPVTLKKITSNFQANLCHSRVSIADVSDS